MLLLYFGITYYMYRHYIYRQCISITRYIILQQRTTLLLYFSTRAYMFSRDEGSATYFRPEIIVVSFLHLMVLLFKVLFNHT